MISFGIAIACAFAIVLLVKGLYPADLPESRNPDFVDNVFDNRGVLLVAHLLLISATAVMAFGGVFIVVSIGIRMKNQEWLRRAGPFEISESSLHETEDETDFWHRAALASREEADVLRDDLRQSEELLRGIRHGR
ncbi:MAG TPA: hypothetical protein VFP21_12120 [Solirubrobacterales bacterium]|nr:hypothetical protein [Solirubrobacterales bacterium]